MTRRGTINNYRPDGVFLVATNNSSKPYSSSVSKIFSQNSFIWFKLIQGYKVGLTKG